MENAYLVDFSTFNDEPVQASLVGVVECWGEGDSNFKGKGLMEIDFGLNVKQIVKVAALGQVTCTGTAILRNSSSEI
jgi:hypothetical protein